MPTLLAMAVIAVLSALFASWYRNAHAPTVPLNTPSAAPTQIRREDFATPWVHGLVVVFTSATCASCNDVYAEALWWQSPCISVQKVEVQKNKQLHDRYSITSVPTLIFADASGVVRHSVIGPLAPRDRESINELREIFDAKEPGTSSQDA